MQLTKKKKTIIASALIRDTHILMLAMISYQSFYRDFKPQIRDILGEEATKELGDMFAKSNFINNRLLEIYKDPKNKEARPYLKNKNGLNHLEEMSMQLLESLQKILDEYKPV